MLKISTIQTVSRITIASVTFLILNVVSPSFNISHIDQTDAPTTNATAAAPVHQQRSIPKFDKKFAEIVRFLPTNVLFDVSDKHLTELKCIALNNYYEASIEGESGMHAVSQVVMNRTEHPEFPKTACDVVYEKNVKKNKKTVCQFSWVCQKVLPVLDHNSEAWKNAVLTAKKMYIDGESFSGLETALFYHAKYVNPKWNYRKLGAVGIHVFYEPKHRGI